MLSLRDVTAIPEYGLAPQGPDPAIAADREVHRALILSGSQWMGSDISQALIVSDAGELQAVDRLLGALAVGRAAALVLADFPGGDAVTWIRDAATRHRFPLLTSTRPLSAWRSGLARRVADLAADRARRHAATLGDLIAQLDTADPVGGVTRALAQALRAEVVLRGPEGIVTATPPTAPLTLASVMQRPDRPLQTTPTGLFAGTVPVGADHVLIVATDEPLGRADRNLTGHAATTLAFALAPHHREADTASVTTAVRGIRLSAFQLLMTGNATHAQRVLAGIAPGLLDVETTRVFIVDCARADREAVMADVERRLDRNALAVRCPAFHQHIIIVAPQHPEHDSEGELRSLRQTFGSSGVTVGGSPVHPLAGIGQAYGEAADALARAAHHPERTVISATRTPTLVDVLPAVPAHTWAEAFLRPILATSRSGSQILESTALAVEFRTSAAARVIGVHRNTVARRVNQVCAAVGLDPERTLDRIVLSLAIQIVSSLPQPPAPPAPHSPEADVSLHDVLTHQQVRIWADQMLRPLADDRRDLVRTLRTWVLAEFNADAAAAHLGIATKTVRSHIRAAEPLLRRDLITGLPQDRDEEDDDQRLSGLRPLTIALYATTAPGAPYPALTPRPRGGS
ncbi:helix-turn-helix domain-containing protein [Streptodolium elevatio]